MILSREYKWPRGMGSICLWYVFGSRPPLKRKDSPPFPFFPTTEPLTTKNNNIGQTKREYCCHETRLAVVVVPVRSSASPTTTTAAARRPLHHCRIRSQQYETMAIRALTHAARAVSSKAVVGTSSSSSRGFSVLTAAEEFPG
jgi:hypothetical protein